MAEVEKPAYLDPFTVVDRIAMGKPVSQKDYSGWLSPRQLADMLGVGYRTGWTLGKKYVTWEKVFGQILFEPESAAEYKIRHDYTRRSAPPDGD